MNEAHSWVCEFADGSRRASPSMGAELSYWPESGEVREQLIRCVFEDGAE